MRGAAVIIEESATAPMTVPYTNDSRTANMKKRQLMSNAYKQKKKKNISCIFHGLEKHCQFAKQFAKQFT